MYCNHCGIKNDDGDLYCKNDGLPLIAVNEKVQLFRENSKFCQNCSHQNGVHALYCMSCGQSLEKIKEKEDTFDSFSIPQQRESEVNHTSSGFITSLVNKNNLIQSAIFNVISVVALMIISFIISSIINGLLRKGIPEDFGALIDSIKLISVTDIFMLSHLTSLNYYANALIFQGSLQTSSGLFILLFIPAIIFITFGYLLNRKDNSRSMAERLLHCFSFSVMYGFIVGIISLFAGISVSIPDPTGFLGDVTVSSNYSFVESIFNALIISFIFTSMGSMIGLIKEQRFNNQYYGMSIARAISSTMTGLFMMIFIGGIIYSSTDVIFSSDDPATNFLMGSQVGGYLWNVSQFETIQLKTASYADEMNFSYSLIGGAKDFEGDEDFKLYLTRFNVLLWLLVLIPIGLHIWSGNQLRKTTNGNILYGLGVYAIAFGFANAVLVAISKLTIDTNFEDAFKVSFGFSTIGVFFISTILAFAISYVTVMLTSRQSTKVIHGQSHSA